MKSAQGARTGAYRSGSNWLLTLLPKKARQAVLARCEKQPLKLARLLYNIGDRVTDVYFPLAGMVSMVIDSPEGGTIEVAAVGNEGVAGAHVALGAERSPWRAIVQIEGEALRVSARDFRAAMARHAALADLTHRFGHALTVQISQSVMCNGLHPIEQRICRWLLMAHDRAGTNEMRLTQEFMAQMLGVRRATVSVAAGLLQKAGFVDYSRGRVTVLNRKGLEEAACECYALVNRELADLMGDGRGRGRGRGRGQK